MHVNYKPQNVYMFTALFMFLIFSLVFISQSQPKSYYRVVNQIRNTEEDNTANLPGAFVQREFPKPSNTSYCDYHYDFPEDLNYGSSDIDFGPELGANSPYRIIYNVISARMSPDIPGITYATHVTADFMNYVPELARYWDGLISIAAFVPDTDVAMVLEQLHQYCYCIPEMSRVSFHLVFHNQLVPSRKDVYFNKPISCRVQDSSKLHTYRFVDEQVMYPINVCRNAARTASLTGNVLVSDIQLMPSEGLAQRFLDMMDAYKLDDCPKRVFVVPIFEIEDNESIPRTKKQLLKLIRQERAVYFHRLVCKHCQKFPGIEAWMVSDPGDVVKPFLSIKREVPYNRWEPIYIGTKNEPLYNEMLSWEGLQDKMLQMLEMCLLGYKFVILDGAFLVHWPGMKKTKAKVGETWRNNFIRDNTREYNKILENLSIKYENKPQCKLH